MSRFRKGKKELYARNAGKIFISGRMKMKGYTEPKPFLLGVCFVCLKVCDPQAYCHYECAWSMSDEKVKRIDEARAAERGFRSQQK